MNFAVNFHTSAHELWMALHCQPLCFGRKEKKYIYIILAKVTKLFKHFPLPVQPSCCHLRRCCPPQVLLGPRSWPWSCLPGSQLSSLPAHYAHNQQTARRVGKTNFILIKVNELHFRERKKLNRNFSSCAFPPLLLLLSAWRHFVFLLRPPAPTQPRPQIFVHILHKKTKKWNGKVNQRPKRARQRQGRQGRSEGMFKISTINFNWRNF